MTSTQQQVPERRPAVDLIRSVALIVVVIGHLSMALIDTQGGEVRGVNVLSLYPHWTWITLLAPMPLFFLAGGYANATASLESATNRLSVLASVGLAVLVAWTVPVVIATVLTGSAGIFGDGARVAVQPQWFFAAYAPLAASSNVLWNLSRRALAAVMFACVAVVFLCDVTRFALSGPKWVGWVGFLPTYGSFWVFGMWWRKISAEKQLNEKRLGLRLILVAGVTAVVLTTKFDYSWALIDVGTGERSNTTPPTFFTVTAGFLQAGCVFFFATALDRIAMRRVSFITRLRDASIGVYLWHLTAVMIVSGLLAAGIPMPQRFSVGWWLARPLWYGAIFAITSALVIATTKVLGRQSYQRESHTLTTSARLSRVTGVVLLAATSAHIGLRGPREAGTAVATMAVLLVAWRCLALTRSSRTA